MNPKWLYMIIGVFLGVVITIVLIMVPGRTVSAVDPANITSGSAEGVIALTTIAPRTDATILWLVDMKNKNLLLYEYVDEKRIKLKALRDIRFDLAIPKGFYLPAGGRVVRDEPTPLQIEPMYKKWADEIKKREDEIRKREEEMERRRR